MSRALKSICMNFHIRKYVDGNNYVRQIYILTSVINTATQYVYVLKMIFFWVHVLTRLQKKTGKLNAAVIVNPRLNIHTSTSPAERIYVYYF